MKTQSNQRPPLITNLQGRVLVAFNIVENDGMFNYDQISIANDAKRDEIISAVILSQYSRDAEIACINNFNQGGENHIMEYNQYQKVRQFAKELADEILTNI